MPKVYMPERLVTNRMIHLEARVLFGILQGTPGFRHNKGCFTYAGLGNLMRHEPEVVATYIRQLKSAGWLELTRLIDGRKIYFTIRDPAYTAHQHILRRGTASCSASSASERIAHAGVLVTYRRFGWDGSRSCPRIFGGFKHGCEHVSGN